MITQLEADSRSRCSFHRRHHHGAPLQEKAQADDFEVGQAWAAWRKQATVRADFMGGWTNGIPAAGIAVRSGTTAIKFGIRFINVSNVSK
ncbi:unnamed protein product [[Candida] boidinii]|uniref:Unnamed protein product n=1 Tax=Candida boidinii TaxID=5477 RepID=A0A9W6SX37_CANBO|nr:unnamed protein product [[Candida] boidinii]GMG00177.1 unnamed protein product [[Candida] boidinii]